MDAVRAQVPLDFQLLGETVQTASLVLEVLSCPRVAGAGHVSTDVSLARLLARVRPADERWSIHAGQFYTLMTLVSDADAQAALASYGLPAKQVRAEATQTPSPVGASLTTWRLSGDGVTLEIESSASTLASREFESGVDYWHSTADGYRRIESQKDRHLDGLVEEAGMLRLAGSPVAMDPAPWVGQTYAKLDESWRLAPQTFRGAA